MAVTLFEIQYGVRALESAIIVPDASALLSLYESPPDDRESLLEILQGRIGSIWIADRTKREVLSRLFEVRSRNRTKSVSHVRKYLSKNFAEMHKSLERRGDLKPAYSTSKPLLKLLPELEQIVDRYAVDLLREETRTYEAVELFLGKILLDDHVGRPLDAEELGRVIRQAPGRFSLQIPPGFEDGYKLAKHGPHRAFGDLIFWEELLKFASTQSKSILIVTSELKRDWWEWTNGRRRPHPLLVEEMQARTNSSLTMLHVDDLVNIESWMTSDVWFNTFQERLLKSIRLTGYFQNLGKLGLAVQPALSQLGGQEALFRLRSLDAPWDSASMIRSLGNRMREIMPDGVLGSTIRDLSTLYRTSGISSLVDIDKGQNEIRYGALWDPALLRFARERFELQQKFSGGRLDRLLGTNLSPGLNFQKLFKETQLSRDIRNFSKLRNPGFEGLTTTSLMRLANSPTLPFPFRSFGAPDDPLFGLETGRMLTQAKVLLEVVRSKDLERVRRNARRRELYRERRSLGICTICGHNSATVLATGETMASCPNCRAKS